MSLSYFKYLKNSNITILHPIRSSARYADPSCSYILASSLNSTHRIIPVLASGDSDREGLFIYDGHKNERYTISSNVWYDNDTAYIVSGSEDGKVCLVRSWLQCFVL